ncbi:MAG: hypothetical protein ACKOX2_11695 [Microcystaceae cyanobacterium]
MRIGDRRSRFFSVGLRGLCGFLIGLMVVLGGGWFQGELSLAQTPPANRIMTSIRPEEAAQKVYAKLTFLPLENQYIRKETGQVDPEHTLMSRLIRYHLDVKKRQPRYRFDWKITLADYLGVNEEIIAANYPGALTLQTNPKDNDVKKIQALNRAQRDELVGLLAIIYKPQSEPARPATNTPGEAKPSPPPAVVDPSKPGLSKPGDAQWLKF